METVANGVHQVHRNVNAFVVDGDEGVVLVDTGLPGRDDAIRATLATVGRSLRDVVGIVITHAHFDHTGGAAALHRDSDATVYASALDAPAVRGDEPSPPPPVADRVPFLRPLMERVLPSGPPVPVDHLVGEDDGTAPPGDLRVIDTPGHTPGHVSYLLDRDGGVLFVGDAAVATRRGEIRRGAMNRPDPVFDASIRHLAEHDFDIACFGHAAPVLTGAGAAFRRFAATLD